MSLFDRAVNFFMGRGWSENQARGIAGNLSYESGGAWHNARSGDNGTAIEMAQWRGDRIARFERLYGTPLAGSTFEQQLNYVDWELNNTERGAGNALRRETTIEGATRTFMNLFERPSDSAAASSIGARISAASGVVRAGGGAVGGWLDGITQSAIDAVGSALDPLGINRRVLGISTSNNPLDTLGNLFTPNLWSRTTAVVIGIILIGLAIAAFVLTSDKTPVIVKG